MPSIHSNSGDEGRPDPDALLERYGLRSVTPSPSETGGNSSRPARGRLRVYLGMAAGVGKTYAMLNEGRRRAARGTDVVVGWIETHGRPLTEQQIGSLEVIPRRKVGYRGITLEEMDLDAILARKPAVVLVDELAHTNAPGSRHAKRAQDVEELLASGVTVITTVNVQHLEGLNDLVEVFTGVRQRETVPDAVLDSADEVELVDISPDALRARLRHGNVYPLERAQKALEGYFSVSNLTALRELALRRVSEKTERQLERMMTSPTSVTESGDVWRQAGMMDRVLVALNMGQGASLEGKSQSRRMLHEGARLARALHAPLSALVCGAPADTKDPGWRRYCQAVEDLGAELVPSSSHDVVDAIRKAVRERQVTVVVVPAEPQREQSFSWMKRGASLAERLLRLPVNADLYIVAARAPE